MTQQLPSGLCLTWDQNVSRYCSTDRVVLLGGADLVYIIPSAHTKTHPNLLYILLLYLFD